MLTLIEPLLRRLFLFLFLLFKLDILLFRPNSVDIFFRRFNASHFYLPFINLSGNETFGFFHLRIVCLSIICHSIVSLGAIRRKSLTYFSMKKSRLRNFGQWKSDLKLSLRCHLRLRTLYRSIS